MSNETQISTIETRRITKLPFFGLRMAVVLLFLYWVAIFTGTHLTRLPSLLPRFDDKAAHFLAYFGLATLMCITARSNHWLRRFAAIAATAMVYAAIDEFTQRWIPSRSPELWDFAADVAGIWTALACNVTGKSLVTKLSARLQPTSQRTVGMLDRTV
jgi:VanZ family protein